MTWILLLALAGAGFYAFHVAPVYLDNLEAKEAVAEAFNVYYTDGEKAARAKLLVRLNGSKGGTSHLAVDDAGQEQVVPGLGLTDENLTITETNGELRVTLQYERTIRFAPLKKHRTFHLTAEKVGKRLK